MADGVPYYKPQEPVIPTVDNTAAKIIAGSDLAGSFMHGYAAFARAAVERKQLQIEAEKDVTDAALRSRQLDILDKNNLLDFQVGMRNANSLEQARTDTLGYRQSNLEETIRHHSAMENLRNDPRNPLSMAGRTRARLEKEQDWADFNKEAAPLYDEANPKNPVDYYMKYQRLKDAWQYSTDARVKKTLGQINRVTDQHTINLKSVVYNESGLADVSDKPKKVPIGQVMENLHDPDLADKQLEELRLNGMLTDSVTTRDVEAKDADFAHRDYVREWLFGKPKYQQTNTTTTLGPQLSNYAKMAAGADFSRGKPRAARNADEGVDHTQVAPSITQSAVNEAEQTMVDENVAVLPESSTATPKTSADALHPPTETDKILAQARRAAKMPGANIDGIKAALQSKNIDPELLDAETE